MSSHEPELDDEDTGPLHLDSVREHPVGARDRRFDTPLSVNPLPVQQDCRHVVQLAVGTAAVVGLGVIAWLFWPSSDDSRASGGGDCDHGSRVAPRVASAVAGHAAAGFKTRTHVGVRGGQRAAGIVRCSTAWPARPRWSTAPATSSALFSARQACRKRFGESARNDGATIAR